MDNRPNWDQHYLHLAQETAKRSHDSQTQHGCILVNNDHEIITTGYNGFIRDIDDSILPNKRPDKYPFMIHAEHNAVLNAARQGRSTLGATAYITGEPCTQCLQILWQAGIHTIKCGTKQSHMQQNDEVDKVRKKLLKLMVGLKIIGV